MYYLHKLEFDGMLNFIFSEKSNPDYNCNVTMVSHSDHKSGPIRDLIALNARVGVVYPRSTNVYTYKGVEYTDRKLLAQTMLITKRALDDELRSYQNWRREWPDNLYLTVNGKEVDRPQIVRRHFIIKDAFSCYDAFSIQGYFCFNFEAADKFYRDRFTGDKWFGPNMFHDAVLGIGKWPDLCCALRDGKTDGDDYNLGENWPLEDDLTKVSWTKIPGVFSRDPGDG